MVGLMVGPNRVTRWKTRGRRGGGLGPVGAQSEAIWKASAYTGVTPSWLKDLKGNGHHMRLGSVGRAEIVDGALVLPNALGSHASTPDDNSLDITGDIEVVVRAALDNWAPPASNCLVTKYNGAGAASWLFRVLSGSGSLRFSYSLDGTALTHVDSTVVPTVANGDPLWVKVTRASGTGDIKFWTSADGAAWTQLGATVSSTAGALFSSTAEVRLGARQDSSAENLAGRIHRAWVKSGIDGTTVFDADFSNKSDGTPWFLESTGKRVTVQPARAAVVDGALWTPGVVGNYAVSPDHNNLDVTGDIEVVLRVAPDDWTPAAIQTLISKYAGAGQRSWSWQLNSGGTITFFTTADGSTLRTYGSTVVVGGTDGVALWLKFTRSSATGTGKFYTSPDGVVWTQLGTDIAGTAEAIFASTTPLEIGSQTGGTSTPFAGKVYRAIVRSGIDGTTVFDCDFSTWANGDGMGGYPEFDATGKAVAVLSDTTGADTNDPKWLKYHDARTFMCGCMKGLYLPGVSGNYASVPDAANLDIVGDITLDAEVALEDWTPATQQQLIIKDTGTDPDRSYQLRIDTPGTIQLVWFTAGTGATAVAVSSTVPVPAVDGQRLWVRASMDIDNGAASRVVRFFTSPDGVTWMKLGADVTGAVTNLFAGAAPVTMGSNGVGATSTGRFFRGRIYNGYFDGTTQGGSLVLDADFTLAAVAEPYASFVTTTGQTVTINRSATGRKAAVVDRPMFLFGTDDYMECAAHADLNFALADDFSLGLASRFYALPAGSQRWLGKTIGDAAANTGWSLRMSGGGGGLFLFQDGTNQVTRTAAPIEVLGAAQMNTAVRNTGTDNALYYVDGTASASTADTTTATLANAEVVRVARQSGAGTNYGDMEFIGAGIWRKALSASEVATLDAEFRTNV